jgi:hypothetical protein
VENGVTQAVILQSSRTFTVNHLCTTFAKEWLLTYQKLIDGALIADMLCVSLYGFLYLIPEDCVLTQKLYEDGLWLTDVRPENDLPTKATCHGGIVIRPNGMIDMRGARILRQPRRQT